MWMCAEGVGRERERRMCAESEIGGERGMDVWRGREREGWVCGEGEREI